MTSNDVYPLSGYAVLDRHSLRVNESDPDKPLFVARDVAVALGYKAPQNAVARHCKGALKRCTLTPGGEQTLTFIPESDVLRLIVKSKLPAAQEFERKVFEEILPTIRKHGMYATPDTLDRMLADPDFGIKMLETIKDEREKSAALEAEIVEQKPAVEYANKTTDGMEQFLLLNAASSFGMSLTQFKMFLLDIKFLEERDYGGYVYWPTQDTLDACLAVVYKGSSYRITSLGMEYIREQLDSKEAF